MMKRVFLVFYLSAFGYVHADVSAQFNEIINALKSENYPVEFIEDSVEKIQDIQFKTAELSDWNAGYHFIGQGGIFEDWLIFPKFMESRNGGFRSLSELSCSDLDSIYHELWHAYFQHHHVRMASEFYKSFVRRAAKMYPHLKRKDAQTALEEAMGVFIGQMIAHYASRLKFQDVLIKHPSLLPTMLEMAQRSDYIGYYYDKNGKIITENTPLPMDEKNWILSEIFELKFGVIPRVEVLAIAQD